MDLGKHFSVLDFLAYWFPGAVSLLGLYCFLLLVPSLTPWENLASFVSTCLAPSGQAASFEPATLLLVLLFVVLSYVLGAALSCFSESLVELIEKLARMSAPKGDIPKLLDDFRSEIHEYFNLTFPRRSDGHEPWSKAHFYLCRSLVLHCMPNVSPLINRQSALRQLRMNLLPALAIWYCVGLCWGAWAWLNGHVLYGIFLVLSSVLFSYSYAILSFMRMRRNERREVREVLTAFLALSTVSRHGVIRESPGDHHLPPPSIR